MNRYLTSVRAEPEDAWFVGYGRKGWPSLSYSLFGLDRFSHCPDCERPEWRCECPDETGA